METILILEWIFYLPSLENGNNILFWIIYYPKLYFLLILSWILQFPFFSSPGYISVPGLEFVLTLTGYFLINQTWGNCIFSKLGFFLKTRKYPGENQVKTGLDFSHFFLWKLKVLYLFACLFLWPCYCCGWLYGSYCAGLFIRKEW